MSETVPEPGGGPPAPGGPPARGSSVLDELLAEVVAAVGGCLGAGVSVLDREGGKVLAAAGVAVDLDAAQWRTGRGPLLGAAREGVVVLPGPGERDPWRRWPDLVPAGPGGADPRRPGGVVVVAAGEPDPVVLGTLYLRESVDLASGIDPVAAARLLARLAAVIEVTVTRRRRADQLYEMVTYRRVIEQAKGAVMAALRSDAGTSFTTLTRASQHFNVRLRQLSIALVEHIGGAPAEVPEGIPADQVPGERDRWVAAEVWAALQLPSTSPRRGERPRRG